jgi:hypothetical protein
MSLEDPSAPTINLRRLFYPKWWLQTAAGFWSAYDFPPADSSGLNVALEGSSSSFGSSSFGSSSFGSSALFSLLTYAAVALLAGAVGLRVGKRQPLAAPTGPGERRVVELGPLARAAALAHSANGPSRRGYEAL